MVLDENGLKIEAFEPMLAEALGNAKGKEGDNVLNEALKYDRAQVQYRDWIYCLAKAPGTIIRKRLIDAPGLLPKRFVSSIEDGCDTDDEPEGMPPARLTSATTAPQVLRMLERAEKLADEHKRLIDDTILTLALVEEADEGLKELLTLWTTEEGLASFIKRLHSELPPREEIKVFNEDKKLNQSAFSHSGRQFLKRLSEEAASLSAKKVTTRHMLYTLLGKESGALAVGLAVRGVDVKRDLHALLTRELARPGRKRNEQFELTGETVFDGVTAVLKHSLAMARERGEVAASEFDIARAFAAKQGKELARLFPPESPLDLPALQAYLDTSDPDDEEDARAVRRFSIKEIEQEINKRVLGQEQAVGRVIPWIKRLRFGLPRDGRPAGVFLFLGPTGTGKTQLAKELARYVYGDEEMMLFMEMGQFQSKESMNMFIGAPPGYVGYGDGKLTNGLRDKSECVVLFDEIDKAYTEVFDTLLRFADEGMISDPAGPVRDGRKCLIVMTTNAGQTWLRSHLEGHPEAREDPETLSDMLFDEAMKEMEARGFRPEFLGRVDERISFLPFTEATCRLIIDLALKKEMDRLQDFKGVTIKVSDEAKELMASYAYKRSLNEGARGAPRAINEFIITPAIDLLSEEDAGNPTDLVAERCGNQIKLEVLR